MLNAELKARCTELEARVQTLKDRNLILANDARAPEEAIAQLEAELTDALATIETLEEETCPNCAVSYDKAEAVFDLADDLVKIFDEVPYDKLEEFGRKNTVDIAGTLDGLRIILKGR